MMLELFKWYYLIGVALFAALLCSKDFAAGLFIGVPKDANKLLVFGALIVTFAVVALYWPLILVTALARKR